MAAYLAPRQHIGVSSIAYAVISSRQHRVNNISTLAGIGNDAYQWPLGNVA